MYWKMQESGLTEIIPLVCTSAIWGQFPVFSHPEPPFLKAHHGEWLQSRWQVFFSSLSSLRVPFLITVQSLFTVMTGNIPFLRPHLGSRPTSYFIHEQSRSFVKRATDLEIGWKLSFKAQLKEWGCFIPEKRFTGNWNIFIYIVCLYEWVPFPNHMTIYVNSYSGLWMMSISLYEFLMPHN